MITAPSIPAVASLGIMGAAFLAIAFAELKALPSAAGGTRLLANFGLGVTNGLITLALPAGTAAASLFSEQRGWGLLHAVSAPWAAGMLLLLLARSLSTYGLHRLSHAVPLLWRFHRVHHSDVYCDLSTSFRSHPVEALLGFPVAISITAMIGPGIGQLITVETLLLTIAMWEHGQIGPIPWVEPWLGLLVATPSQHRLHHSADTLHYNRNFGDGLIIWDRIFGTYASDVEADIFGVSDCPSGEGLLAVLTQPLRS